MVLEKSTLIDILIGNVNANSGEIFDKDKLLQSENRSIMFQKNDVSRSIKSY